MSETVLITGGANTAGTGVLLAALASSTSQTWCGSATAPTADALRPLAVRLEGQVATDRFDEAAAELTQRGLTT